MITIGLEEPMWWMGCREYVPILVAIYRGLCGSRNLKSSIPDDHKIPCDPPNGGWVLEEVGTSLPRSEKSFLGSSIQVDRSGFWQINDLLYKWCYGFQKTLSKTAPYTLLSAKKDRVHVGNRGVNQRSYYDIKIK